MARRRHVKRSLTKLVPAAVLAGVLLAVVGVATSAHAAAFPSPNMVWSPTVVGTTDTDQGSIIGTLKRDFFVGDCVARAGSRIQLAPVGVYIEPIWTQTSATSYTNDADVWHGTFDHFDASFHLVLTIGPLHGAPMRRVDEPSTWVRVDTQRFVSWSLLQTIAWVRWRGEC
jgi:hypothetical protein